MNVEQTSVGSFIGWTDKQYGINIIRDNKVMLVNLNTSTLTDQFVKIYNEIQMSVEM